MTTSTTSSSPGVTAPTPTTAPEPVETISAGTPSRPGSTQGALRLTLPGLLGTQESSSTANPLALNRNQTAERRMLMATPTAPITVQFERTLSTELVNPQALLDPWWTNGWTGLSERLLSGERGDNQGEPDFVLVRQLSTQVPTDDVQTLLTDPVRVSSITLTAGVLWTLTRSGGLLTTILMGVPAWRHVDLLPVLANQAEDDETQDQEDGDGCPPENGDAAEMFDRESRLTN
jgi:hypothetical protein